MPSSMRSGAALLVCLLAPATSLAQLSREQERRADSLFAQYERGLSPGVAVAVIRDGRVVFAKGYGHASLEHGVRITPRTVFDAASVSKQFTGLAVSMLAEEGKLRLDDSVRRFVPELHAFTPPITIGQLLHHTSGLRDWPGMLQLAGWRYDDVITFEHILGLAYRQRTLNFAPGSEHTYSNTGYNLLAEIVARASGQSFRAFTDDRIFRPLGMARSRFRTDVGEVFADRAYGYVRADSAWRLVGNGLLAQGSSSLFTTAEDLAKWVVNLGTQGVGGERAFARMLTPGVLNDGTRIRYAGGVNVTEWRGQPMVTHDGSWASFSSTVIHFPRLRGGVVLLANTSMPASRTGLALSEIAFGDALASETPPTTATGPIVVEAATLDAYAGIYRMQPGHYVHVRRVGDQLAVRATTEGEFPATARSDGEFRVDAYDATITFARDGVGRVTHLLLRGQRLPRMDAPPPARRLADYAGRYESDELSTAYTVLARDSTLIVRHVRRGDVTLARAFGEDFRGSGHIYSVQFERDGTGAVTGLLVNLGARNRNVRFRKVD